MIGKTGIARVVCVSLVLVILGAGCAGDGGGDAPAVAPAVEPGPLAMRRLTRAQYEASIADVLGDVAVAGRIEPDNRRSGLLAVGASFVSVTAAGFEQYEAVARNIAQQALDPVRRAALVPCQPREPAAADDECAAEFVRAVGRRLLRRPLVANDVEARVVIARAAASSLGDFYAGLEAALTTLLLSPEFLFRVESAELDPEQPDRQRLTSLSLASRLSYFLWNTTPDEELLAAAENGDLLQADGLNAQVDRLLASPRVEESVRAFFSDLFAFEDIEGGLVRKDPQLFPAFSQALIDDAREQTLRVVSTHLLEDGDYRDLFITRRSFMTRLLGLIYRVPVRNPMGWEPYELPADGPRAGLLSHVSLLSLYAHPGRSSPTLRGKFVREVLLCQDVPPPPGDIDFSMFADTSGAHRRTARQRLSVHVANEACAGCHGLMDPIGLALEKLDGIGAYRETENGDPIDASGELNGVPFADARGLGEALSHDPMLGPCFVESVYRYAMGRDVVAGERPFLDFMQQQLDQSGYRLRALLRMIATSEAFRTTSGPRPADVTEVPTAVAGTSTPKPGSTTPTPDTTPPSTMQPTGSSSPAPTATASDPNRTPLPSPSPSPTATAAGSAFARLQSEVLTPRCATQFCHSGQTRAGGLVLEDGVAFDGLVGVEPQNVAARQAGWRRVDPFAPENSFLIVKLEGPASSVYGARMPLIGGFLSAEEIARFADWIADGANR